MFSFLPAVGADELAARLEGGSPTHLVDLRDPSLYRAGHIQGSISLPFAHIDRERLGSDLGPHVGSSEPLYLISGSGRLAERAAMRLRHQGLGQVHILDGGIAAWRAAGMALAQHGRRFTLQQQLNLIVGVLLLMLLAKALLLHPVFYVLTGVVGIALVAAAFGDRRSLRRLLQRLPWNRGSLIGRAVSG
jgi:rhodanese-related sulfurtransferase